MKIINILSFALVLNNSTAFHSKFPINKFQIKKKSNKILLNMKGNKLSEFKGSIINTSIFSFWAVHNSYLLTSYNINDKSIYESIFHLMTLIWQYVGLFIISHDLHHSEKPSLYDEILGRLSLLLYGGFILEDFSKNHKNHHKYPGIQFKDPDFDNSNPIIWYLKFMSRYINTQQMLIEISVFFILQSNNINYENMLLFWFIPCIYASIQLFVYGTYLVHKSDKVIINSNLPKYINTFTCYNFGYHREHHKKPKIPWYELGD